MPGALRARPETALLGLRILALAIWVVPILFALAGHLAIDAHAYWDVWRIGPYQVRPGGFDAFNYSPAFAQVIYPLTLLPWPAFLAAWDLLLGAVLLWLLWPLTPRWRWPVFAVFLAPLVTIGNIEVLIAAACVIGLGRPSAWMLPALTKVTPAIGPIWFAARREWRPLFAAMASTAAVGAASFALSPHLWVAWALFLERSPMPGAQVLAPPLLVRLVLMLAVVAWGARTGRRWTLAVGLMLAAPLWLGNVFLYAAALPRLLLDSGDGVRA